MIETFDQQMNCIPHYICCLASFAAYEQYEAEALLKLDRFNRFSGERWEKLQSTNTPNDHCYRGISFINYEKKKIIVAHRGTVPEHIRTWTHTNISLVIDGAIPRSYSEAKNFSQQNREHVNGLESYEFVEVGHSLGGMYAALNSYSFQSKAVAFDSPTIGHILTDSSVRARYNIYLGDDKPFYPDHFINYVTAPDVVNTGGSIRYGKWIRLFVPFPTDFNVVSALVEAVMSLPKFLAMRVATGMSSYDLECHDIKKMVDAFDPCLGTPYLQADIYEWPTTKEYGAWYLSNTSLLSYCNEQIRESFKERNLRYESLLKNCSGYSIGKFILPKFHVAALTDTERVCLNKYITDCRLRYGAHFGCLGPVFDSFTVALDHMTNSLFSRSNEYVRFH
ncbi:MAG: hypothetical protein K2Q14_02890 [Gammaproteobacteria bacterium]|nr:hypothetical protein [Gammaproteobacteria bacterium]